MKAKMLMMDKPTSALAYKHVAEVLDVSAEPAKQGVTMLIVTREMGFAYEIVHRMRFLDEDTVADEGIRDKYFVLPRSVSPLVFPEIPLQHEALFRRR